MGEPVSATATALAVINATAATVGAVKATGEMASGSSGFNVGRSTAHYPMQFTTNQFAHAGHVVDWDVVKFHADGYIWNNDLAIQASGYISHDSGPLVGRPDSSAPTVPVNRFIVLELGKSGRSEDMSSGLLNVNMGPWGGDNAMAEGTPDDPWIALHVSGRFDPVGPGDMEFSFKLNISSFGQISVDQVSHQGSEGWLAQIYHNGDHVLVNLIQ